MARLFVAVLLPDSVLDQIAGIPRPEDRGVRYTSRPQWHVTLRFFGEADVDDAVTALELVSHQPVEAVLGPAVSRLGRSVVVIPVAGLEGLAEAVAASTAEVGAPPDPRPFAGHVTVARLKGRGACGVAGEPISARFAVEEVHLVRSFLEPDGPRYEVVATHDLG